MSNSVIYDFETLGRDQRNSAVVSFAMLSFQMERIEKNPYTYHELIDGAKVIKFDVKHQITRYDRKIDKSTLEWWMEQGDEAKRQLNPSPEDRPISDLFDFIAESCDLTDIDRVYTRGNTFDPMFLQYIMQDIGRIDPFNWHDIRDTRSMIEGLSYGLSIKNDFILDEVKDLFVKHDPVHDIAMDVFRIQSLIQAMKT